jgi:hypothetical protein
MGGIRRKDNVPKGDGVPVDEPIPPEVEGVSELGKAGDALADAGLRAEADVGSVDVEWGLAGSTGGGDVPSVSAVGGVEPSVQTPDQSVDTQLLIRGVEAGE